MKIPLLNIEHLFDTYWFWDGKYFSDNYNYLIPLIKSYLLKCKTTILNLQEDESVFLPIDFSDQYYGAFHVGLGKCGIYELRYGIVKDKFETHFIEGEDTIQFNIGNSTFIEEFILEGHKNDIIDSFELINNASPFLN